MRSRRTKYRGITFRSELEARWAVFFDSAHFPWLYENTGFEFADESSYLPDFFLPGLRAYIELKPASIDARASGKATKLAVESATNVFIGMGLPAWAHDVPRGQFVRFSPLGQIYSGYRIAHCEVSGLVGFTWQGHLQPLRCCDHKQGDQGHTTARLFNATLISRIMRFGV